MLRPPSSSIRYRQSRSEHNSFVDPPGHARPGHPPWRRANWDSRSRAYVSRETFALRPTWLPVHSARSIAGKSPSMDRRDFLDRIAPTNGEFNPDFQPAMASHAQGPVVDLIWTRQIKASDRHASEHARTWSLESRRGSGVSQLHHLSVTTSQLCRLKERAKHECFT